MLVLAFLRRSQSRIVAAYRLPQCRTVLDILLVVIYIAIGVAANIATEVKPCEFSDDSGDDCVEGFTFIDSLYLTIVTISTCGYGDFSPTSPGMKVFTCIYILGGCTFIFMKLSSMFVGALDAYRAAWFRLLDRFDLTPQFLEELHHHQQLLEDQQTNASIAARRRWSHVRSFAVDIARGDAQPGDAQPGSPERRSRRFAPSIAQVARQAVAEERSAKVSGRSRGISGRGIDLTGDGTVDFIAPPSALLFWSQELLPPFVLWLVLQLSSAAIFMACQPSLGYGEAFYHCIITATTVGYGDVTLSTQAARMWASAHILISVSWLAALIGEVEGNRDLRKAQLSRAALLTKRLEREEIMSLDQDGQGIDKLECTRDRARARWRTREIARGRPA